MQATKTLNKSVAFTAKSVSCRSENSRTTKTHCVIRCEALRRAATLKAKPYSKLREVVCRAEDSEAISSVNSSLDANCTLDEIEACSLADLELMYIDSLWSYYQGGTFNISDEDYDKLREELNWQGSGFPTLKRTEVQFVNAAISYARGKPSVSNEKYEELKDEVKKGGKRRDVTALLLYTKGRELLDDKEYEELAEEMQKLGIEVGLKGAACTLTKTPETVQNDMAKVLQMYGGLSVIPTMLSLSPWLAAWFFGVSVNDTLPQALGTALLGGALITNQLVNYLGLQDGEILTGACPCCEVEVKAFFSGPEKKDVFNQKCAKCGTSVDIYRKEMKLGLSGGPAYIK